MSAASAFVWYALSRYDAQLMKDCTYTYTVAGGMSRLVEAIASDGSPEIRLGAPVARLEHTASAARKAEGRVAFAGAHLARGWTSMVDGAIESGRTAAITTRHVLDR